MAAATATALALLRRSARPQLATLRNVAVAATAPRALMSSGGNAPVPTAHADDSTPAVAPEVRPPGRSSSGGRACSPLR